MNCERCKVEIEDQARTRYSMLCRECAKGQLAADLGVSLRELESFAAKAKPVEQLFVERLLEAFRELRMVTLPPHDISGRRMYDKAVSLYEQVAREQRDQDAGPEHVYHLFRREHPAMSYTAGQLYVGTFTTFAEVVSAAREGGGRFDVALSRGTEIAWSEIEEERPRT